ncbi:MAG: hypothetical protein BGO51_02020 [Rhodospirillales bacterium 69-11]|nr:MAG: hypothetical protein BGO51_02020 [Rhodospirillales bacterium 69-11]
MELLLPNFGGGRGVYVVGWDHVERVCRPTVHDRRLDACLRRLPAVTPDAIRAAARDVAAEGLAGREARHAAIQGLAQERAAERLLRFRLLLRLTGDASDPAVFAEPDPSLEPGLLSALDRYAERLGCAPAMLQAALDAVATGFAPVGLPRQPVPARWPDLLGRLMRLQQEVAAWGRWQRDGRAELAATIADLAALTIAFATEALRQARAALADVEALLRLWTVHPDRVQDVAARVAWLLDGWEPICLIWEETSSAELRAAAVTEIATLVPVLPEEACAWAGLPIAPPPVLLRSRVVPGNVDWRTDRAVFPLLQRNEHLRARSLWRLHE